MKDEERLARRKDERPPPLQRRIDNPRIRDLPAFTEFYLNTDKIHHATSEDACAQAVQLQSVYVFAINKDNRWKRRTVSHVNVQRIILFNNTVGPKNVSELILPDPKNRIRIM